MTNKITIVDYGIGNLHSVKRAVEVSGGNDVCVSGRVEDIVWADKLILPGVGAFEDGMSGLQERGLVPHLLSAAQEGKPLLGICLGMQILGTSSEEFGFHSGLGLIPGYVKPIPSKSSDGSVLKTPFIGWAALELSNQQIHENNYLANVDGEAVYLIHSYQLVPNDPAHLLASYSVGGHKITAAVRHANVTGVQFHPEKSGEIGLQIIREFIDA